MPTIEERIAQARLDRDKAEKAFRKELRAGRRLGLTWTRLATISGMTLTGVRYLVENLNEQRKAAREKGEKE